MKRSSFVMGALGALSLGASAPNCAMAHGYLVHSFPAAKMHLAQSPHHVRMLFSLRTDAHYSIVRLEDEKGSVLAIRTQPKTSRGFDMDVPPLAPGRYHLRYRMLSTDGDLIQGGLDFIVDE